MTKAVKLNLKIISLFLVVSVFIGWLFSSFNSKELIRVFTEKGEYLSSEELKIEIENDTEDTICFSSCYPYLMQEKNGSWNSYNYSECPEENIVEKCIEPKDLKAFAITLGNNFINSAIHRLAIPACIGCAIGDKFRVDKILYSNEFEVK